MRPEQKIIMSCRQTGEQAERLLEWLDQSRLMLKAQDRSLRIEVHGIANELLTLVEAVEQPPTAGLIGGWGSARADLVGALMDDTHNASSEDETRLSIGRDRLLQLLPRDSDGGTAVRVRLVTPERAEGPYLFPVRLSLLTQLDLVKILASAYLIHVPPRRQALPTPETIAAALTAQAQAVVHQAFSGMSRRDVDSLRDTLHAAAPDSRALREFDAVGYWDVLGGIVAHLPESLRRRAFALLWGEDPEITALLVRLSDALELLGFAGEVFTGLDGLLGRDLSTSWMARHPDSLIATSTVLNCHDQPDRKIRVSSRNGRTSDVERFLLAALADEVRLPVDAARLQLLETADVLLLPAPRPVMLWPSARVATQGVRPSREQLSAIEALEIFVAQKASYQIDHAVRRQSMTSLLVAADFADRDGRVEIDAASTAQIANWIEATHGDSAHARERRRTGIAILAAEGPGGIAGADPVLQPSDAGDARMASTIEAVLDGNKDWAHEWTPNRPFRNVFTWRPPRSIALPTPIAGQPASAEILRFERARGDAVTGVPPVAELTASHDLANLQYAITQSTSPAIHVQQLSSRLTDLRRSLAARFLRLHNSNDPSGTVEWRRQICHVARNRLEQSAQRGGFGRLQRALMFTESEALAVLARLKADDPRHNAGQVPDLRTLEAGRIVEACVEAWIAAMRQSARAPTLMRAINIPGQIVAHMVDELVIGAVRIGLQEKLSEAVGRIQMSAERTIDCERSIAALMERGINAYAETLDPGARSFRASVHRDTRFGMPGTNGSAAGSATPGRGRRSGQAAGPALADDWAETFADLIEANILGSNLLGGAGHLNRELGEVLNAIAAGPFEGFQ